MTTKIRARITALGLYVPPKVMSNDDLAKIVDTNDEWIRTRTGIVTRHYAEPGVPTSELAYQAARDALERRGIAAAELDLIIVATVTPDMMFPATACIVQDKLGATRAWAFDISAACSGFTYALTMGAQFIESGAHRKVLVIGADVMTSILDCKDRATCVLFGDGAGAVLLEPSDDETGILDFHHEVDGSGRKFLYMPGGGSLNPTTPETVDQPACTTSARKASTSSSSRCARWPRRRCTSSSRTASSPKRSTCSSRTRRTCASSTPRSSVWGCPTRRW